MNKFSKIKIVSLLISLIFVIPQISSAVCLKFWYPSQFSLKNDCPVSANSGTGSIPSETNTANGPMPSLTEIDPSTMGSLPAGLNTPDKLNPSQLIEGGYVNNCSINPNIKGGLTFKYLVVNFFVGCILTRTAGALVAIAVLIFLYGVFRFIVSDSDNKQGGKELMFWGIVGIFVMVSMWGLVAILQNTFNFK